VTGNASEPELERWGARDRTWWQDPIPVQHPGLLRQQAQRRFSDRRQVVDVFVEIRGIGTRHGRARRDDGILRA
ncbi:MAG: hypothetical protein COV48_12270, partial [Elusimicrobia bacterium CG11_big_fil_rev_8_21_14_0_20_64_6]